MFLGALDRLRSYVLPLPKAYSSIELQEQILYNGALGRDRTGTLRILSPPTLPIGLRGQNGASSWNRTRSYRHVTPKPSHLAHEANYSQNVSLGFEPRSNAFRAFILSVKL